MGKGRWATPKILYRGYKNELEFIKENEGRIKGTNLEQWNDRMSSYTKVSLKMIKEIKSKEDWNIQQANSMKEVDKIILCMGLEAYFEIVKL